MLWVTPGGAHLLDHRFTATQLGLDQFEELRNVDVPRDFLNIREPDVFNLSIVFIPIPGNQGCADANALLTMVQTQCSAL